jgi:hypothetical protein
MRLPAFCFVLLVGAMRVAVSQTPARNVDTQPRFDVVSIKRSAAAVNSAAIDRPDGGFTRSNWYTSTLIADAYSPTSRNDIVGLPDLDCAKMRDERAASEPATFPPPGGFPDPSKPPPPCTFRMGPARLHNKSASPDDYLLEGSGTMDDLARHLRLATAGRRVVNRTNLRGSYAFAMNFDRRSVFSLRPDTAPASDTGPDVRSALQDQLGLKLQSARVALDTLTVDHLERPTED